MATMRDGRAGGFAAPLALRGEDFIAEIRSRPPLSELPLQVLDFLAGYLRDEKVVAFGGHRIINAIFPPYRSRAFDAFIRGLLAPTSDLRRLSSVSLAVTNRCVNRCWRCYNAGRREEDLPLEAMRGLIGKLKAMGAWSIALTGGEPLLRKDLDHICACFGDDVFLVVNTSGVGLTARRARRLKDSGVFTVSVSLDSDRPAEHDAFRGRGRFRIALRALSAAREAGLYPYVMTVATRQLLEGGRVFRLLEIARRAGAMEVRLIEPVPVGGMAGRTDQVIRGRHRERILELQRQVAQDQDLPILSTSSYQGRAEAFGCQAGCGHLYIDGSGEVCPCNYIPLSFGNVRETSLEAALDRMAPWFASPRSSCAARHLAPHLARHIPPGRLPTEPRVSERLCAAWLRPPVAPGFHALLAGARQTAGTPSAGVYLSTRPADEGQEGGVPPDADRSAQQQPGV